MRRILGILIGIALAGALSGSVVGARPEPRVAIVVGPVEGLTDLYRSIGATAAREARRWTSDVVTVVSPNATWPAVKRALRGASIVLYLGHGNGWPSPYRDALFPATQDGLGLNPVAGAGDDTHQYFGESLIAREIRLAPGAVVILNHLCYASGNSEPGLPEGSLDVAQQRVDNYSAGWLRAGAGAVVADTFGDPRTYLRALLGGDGTVDGIWRAAPDSHDHVLPFASVRTPGALAALDPTQPSSGFNRSLVWRPGLTAADVRDGSGRVSFGRIEPGSSIAPGAASLAGLGYGFQAPRLTPAGPGPSGLVAGSRATLTLPVTVPKGATLAAGMELGVRWDPVVLAGTPGIPPAAAAPPVTGRAAPPTPGPSGPAVASPAPGAGVPPASPRGRPAPSSSPILSPTVGEPPTIQSVAPEVSGGVVTPARARVVRSGLRLSVTLPAAAGLYRLVVTVHGSDGVAFDGATQSLIPALGVRVSPRLSAAYGVAPALSVVAGSDFDLPVRVANDGAVAWAAPFDATQLPEELIDPSIVRDHPSARLVAHWLPLAVDDPIDSATDASAVAQPAPGSEVTVHLGLTAPAAPGSYLLVLDVASPLHGSLAATGIAPGEVRVAVAPPTGPDPSPAATRGAP